MSQTLRKLIVGVILVALIVPIAACESEVPAPPVSDEPQVGGTLVLPLPAEPRNLDPATYGQAVEDIIASMLGAALLVMTPEGELVPWLAEDYEVSDDGLTVSFQLKEGVKFHNGDPLTAEDFKWTFDRARDPATASPGAGPMLAAISTIEAPEPLTLVLNLSQPSHSLLINLSAAGYLQPLNRKAVEAAGDQYSARPVGVGPYILKEMRAGEYIVLERNPDYDWAPPHTHQGPWYIQEIRYVIIPDQASQIAAFESGQLSGLPFVPQQHRDQYASAPNFQYFESPAGTFRYISMNLDRPILSELEFRQAINHAIDKDAIVTAVLMGHATPAHTAFHPGMLGYLHELDEDPAYPYDPARAIEILEELGYKDSNNTGVRDRDGVKLEFEFGFINSGEFPLAAELIQAQLADVGIKVTLAGMEQMTWIQMMQGGNYDMGLMGWGWSGDAADILLMTLGSAQIGAGFNFARYNSPELDEFLANALASMDDEQYAHYIGQAQRNIVDNAVQVPLWCDLRGEVYSTKIQGIRQHLYGVIFNDAYFETGQ